MLFSQPLVLLLLLILPLLIWRQLHQRRAALRFPDTSLLKTLPSGRAGWVRGTLFGLRMLAVAGLVLALAGPRWPDERTRLPTEGISIGIVLDVSGSMAEEDFVWDSLTISRLDAVKKVFRLFVEGGQGPEGRVFRGRGNDLISLTVFATRPETACPLTLSHDVLLKLLDEQQPRVLPTEAQTNIGDAIAWTVDRLEKAGKGEKVMVLLTDGEHNVPTPALLPRQAAQLAGNLDIPIYVIDAGKEETKKIEAGEAVNRERARSILQDVAKITEGRYFAAADTAALLEVMQELDRLDRERILTYQYRRYHEGFTWFALAAFVLLLVTLVLENTVWRRWP